MTTRAVATSVALGRPPLVFLPSIPVAFASPVAARGMLLLGFVTAVVLERIRHRRQAGLVVDKPLHPSGQ